MDVRTPKSNSNGAQPHPWIAALPTCGQHGGHIQRLGVRAAHVLNAVDWVLMGRPIRFTQARDLLRKDSERASKIVQDSNTAQVRTLRERLARSDGLYAPRFTSLTEAYC